MSPAIVCLQFSGHYDTICQAHVKQQPKASASAGIRIVAGLGDMGG